MSAAGAAMQAAAGQRPTPPKAWQGTARYAKNVIVIAQIEDVEGVDNIDAIARVEGIDALFIGRADLTIAYDAETPDDAVVVDAVDRIVAAGKAAGRTTGMFLGRVGDVGDVAGEGFEPVHPAIGSGIFAGRRGTVG